MRRIARQLNGILEQVPEDFPEGAKLSDIQEVVAAGEYAVALEILCE